MDFCRGAISAGTFFFSAALRFKLCYVLIRFMKTPVLLRTRNMSGCTTLSHSFVQNTPTNRSKWTFFSVKLSKICSKLPATSFYDSFKYSPPKILFSQEKIHMQVFLFYLFPPQKTSWRYRILKGTTTLTFTWISVSPLCCFSASGKTEKWYLVQATSISWVQWWQEKKWDEAKTSCALLCPFCYSRFEQYDHHYYYCVLFYRVGFT